MGQAFFQVVDKLFDAGIQIQFGRYITPIAISGTTLV